MSIHAFRLCSKIWNDTCFTFSIQAVAVFLVLSIPRLLLLTFVLLNFQSCRVMSPLFFMFSSSWRKMFHSTFTYWLFSNVGLWQFQVQARTLQHHPSTAVNIIFFTVKLCTLLNRWTMFWPLRPDCWGRFLKYSKYSKHLPSPPALSTSSSTALWAKVSAKASGNCFQSARALSKEQLPRYYLR